MNARTVNAAYYSDLLARDVKEKIRSKRKTGGKQVAFLQDNACVIQTSGVGMPPTTNLF
jgi:hypothetical protein